MKINANFQEVALVHTSKEEWIPSPMAGVHRKPLDRVGDELARATSIVKYAPNSHFSPHTHGGGEEFIVLEGVFQDENGDYPAGSYVRNPPQSKHQPGSKEGCVIFVKLWQFQPEDRQHVNVIMDEAEIAFKNEENTVLERLLFSDQYEQVKLVNLQPNTRWSSEACDGNEVLVMEGTVEHDKVKLQQFDWLRVPAGEFLKLSTGGLGAKIWVKTGNLLNVAQQIERLQEA
ncbi:cupin domain-containing protein [Glaciecola sp. MF2-115]|uniref:cupin domain-containing protein n=1 Tax=Glaciecola sp. MF2-115 TaxID=3384827 RepID=UPI0039A0EF5E